MTSKGQIGGLTIEYLSQFDSKQFSIENGGVKIQAVVDKTSGDGTGRTPHKRRNEISFRNGAAYNYTFKMQITGSQKETIANLWQIKQLGDKFPRISLGVKRGDKEKLALKTGSAPSVVISDANVHNVFVDCKHGKLMVDGKQVCKFDTHSDNETIIKFGIEADVENVDKKITVIYSDIKLEKIK